MSIGNPHRHYRVCDSTNTRARELAEAGAPHGTVVTAAEQTEGRGRQGRAWTAPPGKALLYSAILRPLGERPLLPLAAGLAVCETAEELAAHLRKDATEPSGVECGVKWPNDVQLDGRKLAGVLIEARPQDSWAVIGVGLNLAIASDEFPPELREIAISLATPSSLDSSAVPLPHITELRNSARVVLDERLGHWTSEKPDQILAAWGERDVLRGKEVAWGDGSGIAGGIDDRGGLVVVVPGGDRIVLDAGEVHLSGT
jgi:BirA family transcriptional regulator, biotin operon repressor / biotin---[acetyl-CoA-carboxylase] ligase